jgi:hypothetical protein
MLSPKTGVNGSVSGSLSGVTSSEMDVSRKPLLGYKSAALTLHIEVSSCVELMASCNNS